METKKHIINLPKNKVLAGDISVQVQNNQLVVKYNLKERLNLIKGKVYFIQFNNGNFVIFLYNKKGEGNKYFVYAHFDSSSEVVYWDRNNQNNTYFIMDERSIEVCRLATPEESNIIFNSFKACNKQWNAEKMCVEDILNPKDGDFLVDELGDVFIYSPECVDKGTFGCYCGTYDDEDLCLSKQLNWTSREDCQYATESEKQAFLEKLKEAGYTWNAEKKCLEEYVWKPEYGEKFYYIGADLVVYPLLRGNYTLQDHLINVNNCFQTYLQAEKKAKELREVLKKK